MTATYFIPFFFLSALGHQVILVIFCIHRNWDLKPAELFESIVSTEVINRRKYFPKDYFLHPNDVLTLNNLLIFKTYFQTIWE